QSDLRLTPAAKVDADVAVPIDILRDMLVFAPAGAIAHADLHLESIPFISGGPVLVERSERLVEFDSIPHRAAIDSLRRRHSAVDGPLVDLGCPVADVFGSLGGREAGG